MAEIVGLADYPLTGAQARAHESAAINAGGMLMNRIFVLYRLNSEGDFARVSQKQFPKLAQFSVEEDSSAPITGFTIAHGNSQTWLRLFDDDFEAYCPKPTIISEFGDETPVIRRGTSSSRWIGLQLGLPEPDILQLGQKPLSWQRGDGRDMSKAKVAPLHIVTLQSLEHAKSLIDRDRVSEEDAASIGVERLRPNIVIDAPEHGSLAELNVKALRIGGLTLPKARDTERCNVPGLDQRTGEKMGDLPHAYKRLPKSEKGVAVLGAYFYPDLNTGEEIEIAQGDKVEFIFD